MSGRPLTRFPLTVGRRPLTKFPLTVGRRPLTKFPLRRSTPNLSTPNLSTPGLGSLNRPRAGHTRWTRRPSRPAVTSPPASGQPTRN